MTLVLLGKGLVLGGWPSKIEVIGVPGIYIYISEVPSGKTNIAGYNIPMFNRKYIFKWPILLPAMLVDPGVYCYRYPTKFIPALPRAIYQGLPKISQKEDVSLEWFETPKFGGF